MLHPAPNYVLVELIDEQETAGGLALPEKQDTRPSVGIVIESSNIKFDAKYTIWFKHFAGEPIEYKGKSYLLIHEDDIVAWED